MLRTRIRVQSRKISSVGKKTTLVQRCKKTIKYHVLPPVKTIKKSIQFFL
jgi:hypothetical protein